MPKQLIDRGTIANDGTGDTIRVGAGKVNDNFNEIYNAIGDGSTLISGTIISDISTATLSNKTINSNANTLTIALGEITLTGTTTQFNSALSDDDFVALTNSVTLTNKTINGPDNTITNLANSNLSGSAGITNANLANSSITMIDDSSTTDAVSLGENFRFTGGSGITSTLGSNAVTFAIDNSVATLSDTQALVNKDLTGSGNTFPSITLRDDSSTTDTVSLGETLVVTGGTGITSVVGSNQVTFNIDSTVATLTGSQTLTNKTINGPDNTITNLANSNLSGSAGITNANLANSTVTLGATSVSLGATAASASNFNITGSSSLSGTGTVDTTGSGNKLRFNFAAADAAALATAVDPNTYEGMFAYNTTENRAYVADTGGWVKLLDENTTITQISGVFTTGIADNYMLKWNSGNARFEAVPLPIPSAAEIAVTHNGSGNYLFDSHYSGANPTIYLIGGHTYAFNLAVTNHPFHIQTVSGAYSSGNAYHTGMTHIADDGTISTGASALLKETGILYWKVPASISGNYYYACQYHSSMAGTITIKDVTSI